ncbi:MAG: hypothetical protein ACTSVU_05095 [Promethearchaeota archaeon]
MKTWQVTVKIGEESAENLELVDIKDILEGYLDINRPFFDELLSIVKMINKYAIGKGLEQIIGPDKKTWTKNPWIFLMMKDNEKEIPFWMLIKREKDLTGHLVAIGPEKFYNFCKSLKEPDDEIKKLVEYIIAYPQKFKVTILIPNFIE